MIFCHISHTPQPPIFRRLEHFKIILCISNFFGSRGGATEILMMIRVQKANFRLYQKIEQMYIYVHANQ